MAEVLITLGIIGVVTAIVMPASKTKLFEQEIVAKFKQTYSILDNAVRMMQAEEGCTGETCFKDVQKPDIETIASNIDKLDIPEKFVLRICGFLKKLRLNGYLIMHIS